MNKRLKSYRPAAGEKKKGKSKSPKYRSDAGMENSAPIS